MIKFKSKLSILVLCAAAITGLPGQLCAIDTQAPVENKETRKKPAIMPFQGKLKSVDHSAKTISVGERVFQITSETKVSKDGKPAVLADAVVGEKVAGAYRKTEDGKLDATTVKFGVETDKEKPKKGQTKKDEPAAAM